MNTRLFLLIKAIAICFAAMWIMTGTAEAACGGNKERLCKVGFKCDKGYAPKGDECKPCGRKNQPSCQPARKGPQCFDYLEKVNDKCVARGGNNERPYSGAGFDCKPNYNVGLNGKCQKCGGKNQVECEKLRKGDQCKSNLENYQGFCRAWGRKGESPWPKERAGYPCDNGLITVGNKCEPCGGKNQPMCRALQSGPQCRDYLGEVDGYCKPRGKEGQRPYDGLGFDCAPGFNVADGLCTACGREGQISCEVVRAGKRCNDGLALESGLCQADETTRLADKVRDAAQKKIGSFAEDLFKMVQTSIEADESDTARTAFNTAKKNYKDTSGKRPRGSAVRTNTTDIPDNNACLGDQFSSWSIGFFGEGGLIGGAAGEAGMVFRCSDHAAGQQDAKWYGSTIKNYSVSGGASAGVTVGMWKADFDNLAGDSHGFTLNLSEALAVANSAKFREQFSNLTEATFELSLSVWYEQNDDGSVGRFAGVSVTLSKGVGVGTGGVYSDVTTYQFR